MKVDFQRLDWKNYPSTDTPLNAENLNRLEEGVAGLYSDMAGVEEGIDSFKDETSAQVGAMQTRLTTMEGDVDSFQEVTLSQVGSMQTRITSMENGLPTIVGEQIDNKFGDDIGDNVTSWLTEHVTPSGSAVVVDDTLSIVGAAADAKKTGDEISDVKDDLTGIHNVVMGKDAFENGAFGAGSGKVNSDYRIRLKNPVYVEKGTELYFSIGNLYSMVWEMSSNATTGGNVIVSKAWGAEKTYYVQNDCWLMISFSKTSSGATQRITVDDFASDYYVFVNRVNSNNLSIYPNPINPNNYSSFLPTLETAAKNTIYRFVSTPAMMSKNGGTWVNCPLEMQDKQQVGIFTSYAQSNLTGASQTLLISESGNMYSRYLNEVGGAQTWTEWSLNGSRILTGIHNVVMEKNAFENGAFGSGSGKVNNDYRIRLKNPVYVEKGTELYFSAGNLYSMVWEMSTNATTGGNVIASKSWGAEKTYYARNDCWVMISFSKTASGSTQRITVDDFADDYYVFVNRVNSNNLFVYPNPINPGNYANFLPTLENAGKNTVYRFVSTPAMMAENGGTWVNCPSDMRTKQQVGIFTSYAQSNLTGTTQTLLLSETGKLYTRYLNEIGGVQTWTPWMLNGNRDITVAKDGSGDFASLTEAIVEATKTMNSHIYVKEGTYDIIAEYKALYGSDFFDTYTATIASTNPGIILKNHVTVEFSPNAFVVCVYEGNNETVSNRFAPFNSGEYGFTLINANVTSRNVRYSVHDERVKATDYYHNRYIGCRLNHDKGTSTGYRQTIGGGLGKNGLIEIENCTFENPSDTGFILSWHNCVLAGARSQILIRNSMIKGHLRFSYYGDSTLVSTMMVTGCKLFAEPQKTQETSGYTTDNVEILSWNNVIGTF